MRGHDDWPFELAAEVRSHRATPLARRQREPRELRCRDISHGIYAIILLVPARASNEEVQPIAREKRRVGRAYDD